MLEVCVDSAESAQNAVNGGADELEVCSCLCLGGLTPTMGLVRKVLEITDELDPHKRKPKVNVMIRCQSVSYTYTDMEMQTMIKDMESFKSVGVDRFVFGSLTDNLDVNSEQCYQIIAAAQPLPVTFHRAFDIVRDPEMAVEEIIRLGFNRLLTSGQRDKAIDPEALALITSLLEMYGSNIEIIPASGMTPENVTTFLDLGFKIVHGTFRAPKRNEDEMHFGNSQEIKITQEATVRSMMQVLHNAAWR